MHILLLYVKPFPKLEKQRFCMAAQIRLLIFTLVFLQFFLLAFASINTGSTLTTNDNHAWLSPSGEFAFGFRQLNGTSTSNFSVAIWYNKIPDKTVVWFAKSNNDLAEAPAGSQVQLTSEGLELTNPQGVYIWTAQQDGAAVSYGAMLDTGNFVLVDGESKHVWETFQHPTDTLLPNQSLQLDLDSNLTSRFTETNYTRGRFQLYFQKNGNVLLSPLAWPSTKRYIDYYKIIAYGSASRLVFDASGDVYVVVTTTNETKVQLQGAKWDNNLTLNPKLYYYRATLDFYGVFTQYAHPRDNTQGWTILRYVPDNICNAIFNEVGSGSCGYNSYCSFDTQSKRPTCNCPDGFSLVDSNNQFGGCQSNFTFVCGADASPEQELYQLHESTDIDFPLGDYASLAPYSQQDCRQSCLQDCMCAVAIYTRGTQTCWKKSLPLINGRENKTGSHLIFVKRPLTSYDLPTGHDDSKKKVLLGPLIGSLLVNSILLATVVLFILLKKPKRIAQAVSLLETNLHSFTYDVLKNATRDFSEELGRGSFGIVYKGTLESVLSHNVVAVKRLDRLGQEREKEFKTELSAIGKTYHKNLVQLIGFCDEGINRLLVYEFMSNGNLADVLFGQHKPIWNVRIGFALGIARGLVYLHEECQAPIIHCDIKPQNILIDEFFTAKISDFGLAKLLLSDQSRTNTMIRGTKGYVAPEWFKNVPVTTKVDVYSFGAMLLEIICCRRSVLPLESGEEHKAILTDWAYDCCIEGRIDVLVENDKEALADNGRLQKWVKIAICCIQEHPEMRPTMRMVMQMLEGVVEVPDPHIPYSFS